MAYDLNEWLRHQAYLERLASGGINSVVYPSLRATYEAIVSILSQNDIERPSTARLNAIVRAINKAIEDNNGWTTLTAENLAELAIYENQWQAQWQTIATGEQVEALADNQISKFMASAVMVLESGSTVTAGVWADFIAGNIDSQKRIIDGIAIKGYTTGETISQIKRNMKESINGIIARQAETLARTGYAHYAAQANEAMILANADILEEYYYAITFDNRTSDLCLALDKFNKIGNRFKVGDPKAPKIPRHPNCRTRRLALPAGEVIGGTKASVGGQPDGEDAFNNRRARQLAYAEREETPVPSQVRYRGKKDADIFKVGQIPSETTIDSFLLDQPKWFIEDTLGATRAKLFLQGGLSIAKFSDIDGQPLTLEEIRKREPKAFRKIGL